MGVGSHSSTLSTRTARVCETGRCNDVTVFLFSVCVPLPWLYPMHCAAPRPWYGFDDTHFVKGVEGVFTSCNRQRLVTKSWLPPPEHDVARATAAVPAPIPRVAPDVDDDAPFPSAVIVFVHGYVRAVFSAHLALR
jgi:hypothetical protein